MNAQALAHVLAVATAGLVLLPAPLAGDHPAGHVHVDVRGHDGRQVHVEVDPEEMAAAMARLGEHLEILGEVIGASVELGLARVGPEIEAALETAAAEMEAALEDAELETALDHAGTHVHIDADALARDVSRAVSRSLAAAARGLEGRQYRGAWDADAHEELERAMEDLEREMERWGEELERELEREVEGRERRPRREGTV